jgi:hypothetical protein
MEKKVIYDSPQLDDFVSKYSKGQKDVNLAFGLRPSGVVHLGNLFTLALASELTNKIGPHISNLVLTICDLDLPSNKDWDLTSKKFAVHYRDLPCEGYNSFSDRAKVHLEDFMEKLNKEMTVPFSINHLSSMQKDISFRKGLKNLLEDKHSKEIIGAIHDGERIEVYPLCPKCGTSYTNTLRGKINKYEDGFIHTTCTNPDCEVKDYKLNILDPSFDISVHPLMGALRDFAYPRVDAHIYGGDYSYPHGETKEPKVKKIRSLMDLAFPREPLDFFVGPTIFARGREKMSKSLNNGLDYNHLKKFFGDDYVKRIMDFTRKIIEKEYSVVDFAGVQENLLG